MFDADEAFFALEQLDSLGRKALMLAGRIYEEMGADALARAEKAEFLFERLYRLTSELGLGYGFDLAKAAREWQAQHERPATPLTKRYLAELSERAEEVRDLRKRLDDALDGREASEIRAERAERRLASLRSSIRREGRRP